MVTKGMTKWQAHEQLANESMETSKGLDDVGPERNMGRTLNQLSRICFQKLGNPEIIGTLFKMYQLNMKYQEICSYFSNNPTIMSQKLGRVVCFGHLFHYRKMCRSNMV